MQRCHVYNHPNLLASPTQYTGFEALCGPDEHVPHLLLGLLVNIDRGDPVAKASMKGQGSVGASADGIAEFGVALAAMS